MKLTFILFLSCASLTAQTPAVFASGLLNPSKLLITPAGNLLVTEAGTTPNSGRVSILDMSGTRKTLIEGLPSGLAEPDLAPDGPNGLIIRDNILYILNGEGDGFRAGTKPNTIVPNPDGSSSSILSSILRVTLPGSVDTFAGGVTLTAANHKTLGDGNPVTAASVTGSVTIDLLTDFRDGVADPVTGWRNSHPYGMVSFPSTPEQIYVVDAGMNCLYVVNTATGRSRVLTYFAPFVNNTPGPPVSEAVPDSVRVYGDQLLVSFLRGFPFTPGGSQIVSVDPSTGKATPFIANLSSSIDVISEDTQTGRPVFFTLEYSANQLAGAPGRVTRYDTVQGQVIADGLKGPTSLAYDANSQTLYVALHDAGTIVKITGQ